MDPQGKKWQITINNPAKAGLNRDAIEEIIKGFSYQYVCMADEIGDSGTPHTHIFLYTKSNTRFSTIKKRFPIAHIERARGTVRENRAYIKKEGKWQEDEKGKTSIPGTFTEFGEIPTEREEKSPDMSRLIDLVKEGKGTSEIVDELPKLALRTNNISSLKKVIKEEEFLNKCRELKTIYIYGDASIDKLKHIYDRHEFIDICRITNYREKKGISFDTYRGQDVIVFDNFEGQIILEEFNSYLDKYPLTLPSRYEDRIACYTKVYIVANMPLKYQYAYYQDKKQALWDSFIKKIDEIWHVSAGQNVEILKGGKTNE